MFIFVFMELENINLDIDWSYKKGRVPYSPFNPEYLKKIFKLSYDCPVCIDWIFYKNVDCCAQPNIEASLLKGRLMMDISYCMTKALNQIILETVAWDPKKFKPSDLGNTKW